jgi:hypothetical protein
VGEKFYRYTQQFYGLIKCKLGVIMGAVLELELVLLGLLTMKKRYLFNLFVLFSLIYPIRIVRAAPLPDPDTPDAWILEAPGIEYQKFHLNSPRQINIFVTRMDRNNLSVTIDSAIAQGRLSGGTDSVSSMAASYDQTINYWGETWGNRNHVVAAINGYFFGPSHEPPGVPWSGIIHSSWHAKRFTETVGDAGFTWFLDGNAFIGKCVYYRAERNDITFPSASYDPNIDAVNVWRSDEELILYTPQFDSSTRTLEGATPRVEISVQLTRPSLLISDPSYVNGTIIAINRNTGSTPIPFDHVVISAWGNVGSALISRINSDDIQVGDAVHITQEIKDCTADPQHDWSKAYAGIGGDYHFLRGGTYYAPNNTDATVPNSRTVIAYNASYVFFVVVDAFDPGVSMGMTIRELSDWMENNLGATDAVSQDSGGSSTMVVNGVVVNNTTCNFTRQCGTQAASTETPQPGVNQLPTPEAEGIWDATDTQASVGDAMMMIVVQPLTRSASFRVGQTLTVLQETSLRLGPGGNYGELVKLPAGAQGVVISHSLNGVLATNNYWWKASFGENEGWVKELSIQGGQVPPPYGDEKIYIPLIESLHGIVIQ